MANDFFGTDFSTASAPDILKAALKPYGLDDNDLINQVYTAGKDQGSDAAYLTLRQHPKYQAAFPGMKLREQNGLAPINEQQYTDYKSQITSTLRNAGIPAGFYDNPDDFAKWIGVYDASPAEVESRINKGVLAAQQAPPEVKQALFDYYGIDEGHLAAYWLDPNVKGPELLQQQAATYAGGAAASGGFKGLTRQEAEGVAAYNQSPDQLASRFGALTQGQELMGTIAGEATSDISREQQLKYAEGSPEAAALLAKKAAQRKAQFGGGTHYAETAQGVVGLGRAQ